MSSSFLHLLMSYYRFYNLRLTSMCRMLGAVLIWTVLLVVHLKRSSVLMYFGVRRRCQCHCQCSLISHWNTVGLNRNIRCVGRPEKADICSAKRGPCADGLEEESGSLGGALTAESTCLFIPHQSVISLLLSVFSRSVR